MKNLGDGYIAIFDSVDECAGSGIEVQKKLKGIESLPDGSEILARIVGHAGPLQPLALGRGYFGRPLNRASRICQVCHPGQMLVSDEVRLPLTNVPEDVEILDLGVHHLRDLAEPEHLFQVVVHPEFPIKDFPPLPTLEFRPNNLVYQPNTFIGRERVMSELKALILAGKVGAQQGKQRLITIVAPGDTEKTGH